MRGSREFELPTLLATIVESANDSIVSATLDGVITSWNAAAERLYGYTAAEIIGRSTSLLIPPETAPELTPVLQRVRQGETIEHFETRLRRKDGSIIEVSLTDSPLRDASGAVVGTSSITRDMTERNRAEALFRGLLEAAPDAMVCVDSGGRIVLVNAQAERLFGYPREELAGQPVEILVPDAIKAGHPDLRAGYAADPRPRQMGAGLELSARRRDGTTFPAEIALSALDTDQGLLVSAAIRDVTQQQQAALAQARLASIIESSHDAVLSLDLDGLITTWNPGAERLYGYTAGEIIGRHSDLLLPADQRSDVHKILASVSQGEKVEDYQAERVRKDGTTIAVMVMLASIADKAGTITGLSAVMRDISVQQRAEARFRGLLEAAPDATVCVDSGGRIVLVNAQAERLFGYPREELAGQPVEILVPDAIKAGHPDLRAGYAADPRPRQMGAGLELSARRRDGTTFPAEIALSALDTDQGLLISAAIRDVTQQRQAEARFRGLLEAAPDAMVCVDSGGRIVLVNAQAERLFGYPREELAGQPVEILVPDAIKAGHPDLRAGYAADPRPRQMGAGLELSARRRDGTTFPAEIALSALDTDQGLLVSAAIRDVTQQRQAALAQALLASIIVSSHDAVIGQTLDRVITTWNPAAEQLYGYTAAEMIGTPIYRLVPGEHLIAERKNTGVIVRGERLEPYQTEGIRKNGTTVAVSVTLSPITDQQGTIIGMSGVSRDISAHEQADARFRGLLEAAPDATVCVDSGGRIVLVNAQAERLFGYPREELAGQPVEILVPDAIKAGHPDLRAGYAADPRPRQMGAGLELSARRRDGTTFPAEIALSALDTDQGLLVSAAIRDVTEQRQARDDLRRSNQNLESFSYSLAHDLRTPLRSLAGFSTVLIEDYADTLGEDGRGYAQRIEAASEHMGHILDDLLRISRISGAKISLRQVDLGAEAATIAVELQRQDPGRRVCFTIQQPARAMADVVLIREVLHNLLANAWKFTRGRDNASIEFGMTPATDGRVCCYVRDNGAGFDPAYTHKLFQPFQRLHTTREFPGTGIGLASVRQIVDRHNGRAWAEGTAGNGATFFFTLQAAEPSGPPDK